MKKRVLLLLAVITAATLLAACTTKKTPITAATFRAEAEAAGFTVQDSAYQLDAGSVEDYLIAYKGSVNDIDFQIEFAVVPTVEQAQNAYQENKADFEAAKGTVSSYSSVSIGNYSYYKQDSAGRYCVISRIDNTFIYIDTASTYKKEINDFLKKIGY